MLATVDLIHTVGELMRPPLRKKSTGVIVMMRNTSVAFTTELHRLTSVTAVFFPVNGEASSIPSQLLGS